MSKANEQESVVKIVSKWTKLDPFTVGEAINRHELEHRLLALKKSGKLKGLI